MMRPPLAPPSPHLRACVVVPARDEEALVARCVRALATQEEVPSAAYEVLLVVDRCVDDTEAVARAEAAAHPALALHVVAAAGAGAGRARRTGMDLACERLVAVGRPHGLIASTDADSVPAPDWLRAQLDAAARGARAIGGLIVLDGDGGVPPEALRRRDARLSGRLEGARAHGPGDHAFFSGASLAVTAEAYRTVGGLEPRAALEDQALEEALSRSGIPIDHASRVRVRTSSRTSGRAPRGLSADLRVDAWLERRGYRASDFSVEDLVRRKADTVSVVLPAREVAETIGPIVDALRPLEAAGLLDEVLVIDADSRDGTARAAAARGARVLQESELMEHLGPCQGKGDAMWRALGVAAGDIVCFIDADTIGFEPHFAVGMLGPLLTEPDIQFVKGSFRRPLRVGAAIDPDGGGRVTELMARPLLSVLAPDLGGFGQPLAGETAARAGLLARMPFPVGYGVETALLMDAHRLCGLDAMAQVDLGSRLNRHQPLRELSAMALAVLCTGLRRGPHPDLDDLAPGRMLLPRPGDQPLVRDVPLIERPPLASLRAEEPRTGAHGLA